MVETVVPKGVGDQRSRSDIAFADKASRCAASVMAPARGGLAKIPIGCNSEPAITGLALRHL